MSALLHGKVRMADGDGAVDDGGLAGERKRRLEATVAL